MRLSRIFLPFVVGSVHSLDRKSTRLRLKKIVDLRTRLSRACLHRRRRGSKLCGVVPYLLLALSVPRSQNVRWRLSLRSAARFALCQGIYSQAHNLQRLATSFAHFLASSNQARTLQRLCLKRQHPTKFCRAALLLQQRCRQSLEASLLLVMKCLSRLLRRLFRMQLSWQTMKKMQPRQSRCKSRQRRIRLILARSLSSMA
mmetsp:Transcript_22216/g.35615  ORF Transcript_22216/g.35615 Transcript_22216/m.35615 type:complete len:201 (+) Transcript_22216:263-865(+)